MWIGTIFDTISYLIPGYVFLFLIKINVSQDFTSDNVLTAVVAYLIGNVLHTITNWKPKSVLWWLYHLLKERNNYGHGVKTPRTFRGKIAIFIRYKLIKDRNQNNDSKQNELLLLKQDIELSKHFSYLDYQRILSDSLSVVFLIFLVVYLIKLFYFQQPQINIYLGGNTYEIQTKYSILILSFFLLIFRSRLAFFNNYKKYLFTKLVKKHE